MKLSPSSPVRQREAPRVVDKARLKAVAAMPCVICHKHDMTQRSMTQVHHCLHGRGGTNKAGDGMVIPLCEGHHQGDRDTSKVALHRRPNSWRDNYGYDTDYLSWVEERIE